ncbi:MAG: hypothetical protein R3350_08770 [Saprospiraceae bacterium]|nr:hypothetical protein [Saprospiraceae bacterium]
MFWYTIGYAFFIAVILALLFSTILGNRGPWNNFWILLLILFLIMWGASLWFNPVGPMWYGVAWLDLVFIGLIVALLLAAAGEANARGGTKIAESEEVDLTREAKQDRAAITMFGIFFWLFVAALTATIVVGLIYQF